MSNGHFSGMLSHLTSPSFFPEKKNLILWYYCSPESNRNHCPLLIKILTVFTFGNLLLPELHCLYKRERESKGKKQRVPIENTVHYFLRPCINSHDQNEHFTSDNTNGCKQFRRPYGLKSCEVFCLFFFFP